MDGIKNLKTAQRPLGFESFLKAGQLEYIFKLKKTHFLFNTKSIKNQAIVYSDPIGTTQRPTPSIGFYKSGHLPSLTR